MRSKLLIGGLLASVIVLPALAQSNPSPAAPAPAKPSAAVTTTATPISTTGEWRASKLIGLNVYNDQNEKLGDISELILDQSGKVDGVIVGVGGFLGMGQHDIKVEWSKLKFVNEPVRSSATTSPTTTGAAGSATNRATTAASNATSNSSGKQWYPDHAVLSGATKDQLKSMPQFKY